jgi:hypothetical protein
MLTALNGNFLCAMLPKIWVMLVIAVLWPSRLTLDGLHLSFTATMTIASEYTQAHAIDGSNEG